MRPSGLVMDSMASTDPFGFTPRSMDGAPFAPTYWVAIWPFAASSATSSGDATKRPSPWLTGTV